LLNDKLSELGAKKFLSPSDNIKEQQLRIRISSLNSQLASLKEGDTNYKSARRNLLAAQKNGKSLSGDWKLSTGLLPV
jgi:hypothetical protein